MVARQKMEVYSQGLGAVPSFVTTMASISILGVGALRVMSGDMSIGSLVAFQALMMGFMHPINQLVDLGASLQEVEGQLNRLDDVLRYETDPGLRADAPSVADGDEAPKLFGQLELKNVAFEYSPLDPPLIQRFSLTVKPGARVAIVGSSASGKSTMAKLISGLYQPWSGQVLLDGRPRREIPRATITNSVAMVDQDFFLYEGTLREVLTMWDDTRAGRRLDPGGQGCLQFTTTSRRDLVATTAPSKKGAEFQQRAAPAAGDRPSAGRHAVDPRIGRGHQRA